MFTLEDIDLSAELEYFRINGLDVLHAIEGDSDTSPEADARLHPTDYFIAGV
ncbi:MAG: hypothetical protein M9891_09840 [Austwickia sp.]|nr:hypothetical protein [Actinomycetota bacterium]MCB1254457.1 hypothetical protein [Austwickia sp.]MCO5309575.1 hypothetical protein [Austwickia sp.]